MSNSLMEFFFIFIVIVSVCRFLSLIDTFISVQQDHLDSQLVQYYTYFTLISLIFHLYQYYYDHVMAIIQTYSAFPNISSTNSSNSPIISSPYFSSVSSQYISQTQTRTVHCLDSISISLIYFTPVALLGSICPCSNAHVRFYVSPLLAVCILLSIGQRDLRGNCCVAHNRTKGDQQKETMNLEHLLESQYTGQPGTCCSLFKHDIDFLEDYNK